VLAVLVLHANRPVSAERPALALCGEEAPAGAVKTIQVHVSRLRKALDEPARLSTTPAGYQLRVEPGELDTERFAQQVDAGRQALADGDPDPGGRRYGASAAESDRWPRSRSGGDRGPVAPP
jgi:DNA-binding SARP family transcriptional activator